MADSKIKIKTDVESEASLKKLRELRTELKKVGADSAEFKRLSKEIKDVEDSLEEARAGSKGFVDLLEEAPGPIGALARGFRGLEISTKGWGIALKATGIGLIVSAIGGLVAALTQTEGGLKKLQPLTIAFEKILGGIFRALEPLIDGFVSLATKVLPYVTKGIGVFYSALVGLFTYIKEAGTGVAKVWKGIFTLDFESVKEGVNQIKNSFAETAKATTEAYKRFEVGTKEQTKTQKEEAEKQAAIDKEAKDKKLQREQEALKKQEELRKQELEQRKAQLDAQIELEVAKENTNTERLRQLLNARYKAEIEDKKLSEEEKLIIKQKYDKILGDDIQTEFDKQLQRQKTADGLILQQLQANLDRQKALYGETSQQVVDAQNKIFEQQKLSLQNEKALLESKKELTDEEKNRLKEIEIAQQNLTTAEINESNKRIAQAKTEQQKKREDELKTLEENKGAYDREYEQNFQRAEQDLEQQQMLLNAKIENDRLYYEQKKNVEGLTAKEIKKINDEETANQIKNAATQKQILQKKTEYQIQSLQAYAAVLQAVSSLAGNETKTGKRLAAAASLINTYAAIAGQLKAFSGVPIPGFAIVQAIATGLVGFKAVSDILKTNVDSPTQSTAPSGPRQNIVQLAEGGYVSGPGTGTSDSIPARLSNGESVINAKSTQLFKPLLSTINQIGGGRRFAEGGVVSSISNSQQSLIDSLNKQLTNTNNAPIKTYVVAGDVTSIQQFEREAKYRSTL